LTIIKAVEGAARYISSFNLRRRHMRISIIAITAGTVLSAAAISGPAGALPAGNVGAAAANGNPVEQIACWRFGPRGWGWYAFCAAPPPPPPPAYAAWDYLPPNCKDTTVREQHWGDTEVHHYRQCY
jgi:hypothetical protein